MTLTEALFTTFTGMTVGAVPPANITAADFATKNTIFAEFAADDGLTGNALDLGTAYLIADSVYITGDKVGYESEKIGSEEYSYKKGKSSDMSVSIWMAKYNALIDDRTSLQPSAVATRKDADMSAVNLDQNPVIKFYGV